MKYFNDCATQEELKKRFRELCKKLHPDNGGRAADFIAMKKEFEKAAAGEAWRTFKKSTGETYTRPAKDVSESPAEFMSIIEKLVLLEGVTVEICGTWLWISGNTYKHKEFISSVGGRWSRNKKAWYIHHEKYRKRSKKIFSLDDIRNMYGSTEFTGVQREKLAPAR